MRTNAVSGILQGCSGQVTDSDAGRGRMEAVKQGRGIQGLLGNWISSILGPEGSCGFGKPGMNVRFSQ